MCGIYGTYGGPLTVAEALRQDMIGRGPDAQGIFVAAKTAVGMNRLHLWGDRTSDIPFRVGNAVVGLNGEIYGRLGEGAGYVENDAGGEGEIKFLEQSGSLANVDGMFAIAGVDPDTGDLSLCRDRFGIKPLFYGKHPQNGLVFSSCIRSMFLKEVGFRKDPNLDSLFDIFAYGFPLTGQTAFESIQELLPGWQLNFDATSQTSQGHCAAHLNEDQQPDARDLRRLLRRALMSCAKTEYPIGLAVSGGIDSTILAHELNALDVESVTTFSVVLDEVGDGVERLDQLGLPRGGVWETWNHRCVHVTKDAFLRNMWSTADQFAYPTDMHSMPLYAALAEIVQAENIRILLTGEGADEYFMGYAKYRDYAGEQTPSAYYLSGQKGSFLFGMFERDIAERGKARVNGFSEGSFLSQLRKVEIRARLQKLLLRSDVVLMEHGIEGRTPFLHGGIPELALSAMPETLIGQYGKQLLRDAYSQEIIGLGQRSKRRFKAPEKLFWEVFEDDEVREVLFAPWAVKGVNLSEHKVREVLEAYAAGDQSDLSELLFLIFTTKKIIGAL